MKSKIKQAEEVAESVADPDRKKIAFKEVLRELLRGVDTGHDIVRRVETSKTTDLPDQFSEFLSHLTADSHFDRVISVLYFSFHKGVVSMTLQDLAEAYSSARIKSPANFSDVMGDCIRKGYIIEARDKKEGKKAWQITPTGEKYVKEELTQAS